MDWSIVATSALAFASAALSVGVILLLGVLGGQWALRRQIIEARDAAELANTRIQREIKVRAGQQGVEARQEAKSLEEQARAQLAAAESPSAPRKPSVAHLINGGRR